MTHDGAEDDDAALTRAAHEPEAFEPLVARHSDALHAYLDRRAPHASDDLLAEVWLRAFAGRKVFDAAAAPPPAAPGPPTAGPRPRPRRRPPR
ncbi:MAG TPA: hypothetical protein VGL02_20735, partial [Streptomyces sp.]